MFSVYIGEFLLLVNSSVNFLIYVFTGKRFRKILLQNCRCVTSEKYIAGA